MPAIRLAVLSGFGLYVLLTTALAATEYDIGIVPQQSPVVLAERWIPLLQSLTSGNEAPLRFATAPSITTFEERSLKGVFDFAYMNSALFLEAQKKAGYRALVRRERPLTGIIVTRTNGPVTLSGLVGQTLAFPAPRALGATLLPRMDLKQNHISYSVAYLGTHESAYRAVAQGRYIAAGGVERSFNQLTTAIRRKLKVLHRTQPLLPHIIAAHPRVPENVASNIRERLLNMHRSDNNRYTLNRLGFHRFVEVTRDELARFRKIDLGLSFVRRTIDFHVIPRMGADDTIHQMLPLAAYLKQRLEITVSIKAYDSMNAFEESIYADSEPAIIMANPLQALRLAKQGYEIFAHQLPVNTVDGMHGYIIVRDDSSIHSLNDLRGKRIAFSGNNNSFFATIVPKVLLKRSGLAGQYYEVPMPRTIAEAMLKLRDGYVDAIGVDTLALNSPIFKKKYGADKVRVITKSAAMPGLAWLLSDNLDADINNDIRQLLLNYNAQSPGHSAMQAAGFAGLRPATQGTYDMVHDYIREYAAL